MNEKNSYNQLNSLNKVDALYTIIGVYNGVHAKQTVFEQHVHGTSTKAFFIRALDKKM